jgi:CRP/FNR family transcriptional regulator, cyclic AMP receptor protein
MAPNRGPGRRCAPQVCEGSVSRLFSLCFRRVNSPTEGVPPFPLVDGHPEYPGHMARGHDLDLSKIWLFSTSSARDLRTIRRALEEVTVPPGRVLTEEGTIGREFFLIAEGTASVRRNGRKIATLGPGKYFGELALLDRRPRSATIVSDTDMLLLVLGQRQFNGVLDAVPALCRKLLAAMATRLREADAKAIN